ncbi:hypothetical protein JHK84_048195 [Glycine max]|nr:hypothetical protein JHK84_048195 [Glycine max]
MMVTWDDSESEKSNSFDNEKANICLMVDTYDKVEVKTCSKSYTSYCASSDDEEDMPTYDPMVVVPIQTDQPVHSTPPINHNMIQGNQDH